MSTHSLLRERTADPEPRQTVVHRANRAGIALQISGLSKVFDEHVVLDGLDLEVPAGQFLAVVGRSGCGKSTLLRLVAGLDTPSAGSLSLGHGPSAADDEKARIVFQEPRLLPWARVIDNVEVGLAGVAIADRQQVRRRAAEALREVGLAGREMAWPSVLSGGQKQRVALARALISHPRLLALDEPLGALDALTRLEMQRLVELVWLDQGFTTILVTHDVGEAVALADRVVVIDRGRVRLDLPVLLPRPRPHGSAAAAALAGRILHELLDETDVGGGSDKSL